LATIPGGVNNDNFGQPVYVDADVVVVGAPFEQNAADKPPVLFISLPETKEALMNGVWPNTCLLQMARAGISSALRWLRARTRWSWGISTACRIGSGPPSFTETRMDLISGAW
jgi:hypothetical protein